MKQPYKVEILNSSLQKIAEIRALYPLNRDGDVLRFTNELSYYGVCTFRIATEGGQLTALGDIFVPHQYHVRIKRYNKLVWAGAITDNPSRNKNFIEVEAREYLFYLDKKLVQRDTTKQTGFVGDDFNNYRYFSTGTMSAAVTSVLNQAIAGFGSNHILSGMTLGTIENPNYPKNFAKPDGNPLTGAWNFSVDNNIIMQFDYHTVLHVIRSLGNVSASDFKLDENLEFTFKNFLGEKQYDLGFSYGTFGNIIDYDVPRYGRRVQNKITGLATDSKNQLLHITQSDSTSINAYGVMESATAYDDVINKNILGARLAEDLYFIADPETAPINIELDDKTYPLGTWGVGDIVDVKIKDGLIDFKGPRRIVGISTSVHNTGKEIVRVQTNKPREEDL